MKKLLILSVGLLVIPMSLSAKDKGHGHHDDVSVSVDVNVKSHSHGKGHANHRFSDNDRKVMVTYFSKHRKGKGLPPGIAKKLSPAQEKFIVVNTVLPPDIFSLGLPFPPLLLPLLPPPPPGMMLMMLSGKAVTVETRTRRVVDCVELNF